MKLFYVVGFIKVNGPHASHMHVHATTSREAMEVAFEGYDMLPTVHVYDLSQDALCPGRLDLEKVPREEFKL